MVEIHVFSNIGGIIESSLVQPAQKIAVSLSGNLIPFVGAGLTIWVMVYALASVRGAVHTPFNDFVWRVVKISLILSFGMAGGIFQPDAFGFYNAMSNAIYNAISLGSGGACPVPSNDPMGIYGALDCVSGQMLTPLLATAAKIRSLLAPADANFLDIIASFFKVIVMAIVCFLMLLVALLLTLGLIIYTGFEVIALRVTLALAFAVSPLFIYALAFEPIKNLFSNWLNVVIESIIFQALFIAFMGMAFGAITNLEVGMLQVADGLGLESLLVVVIINLFAFVIMIGIFIFTASRIPHLAAKLGSGGAGGAGLGTLMTAMAGRSLYKWTAGKLGSKPKQGGTVTNNG